MNDIKRLPARSEVAESDTWDLSKLYANDEAWETAFLQWESQIEGYDTFRGKLADSPDTLAQCLAFDSQLDRIGERLGNYAYLRTTEDQTHGDYQRMIGRFQNVATKASEASSFIRPEILAMDEEQWASFIEADVLSPYQLMLERLVRLKPHTLSEQEEELLAMQGEMAGATSKIFRQLHDADLKFGVVENELGEKIELSPSTFSQLLISPKQEVRKNAFHQFYEQFTAHENSLSAILCGSIQKDVYYARARNYPSALEKALFADKVPVSVYDNLIATVRKNLPALHKYYDLRRRKMNLETIHQYDTYVPILSDLEVEHSWDKAVNVVCDSLKPLGDEYCEILHKGLSERWCDRYPNQGKQSGAFSYGTYDGDPYIMMNYKPRVLNDVFTLATWQPFQSS